MKPERLLEIEAIANMHNSRQSAELLHECLAAIRELQAKLAKRQATAVKRGQFVPPTLEQVTAYFKEGGIFNGSSAETAVAFVDFYEARAWKLTQGVRMSSWEAACRTWENREKARRYPVVGKQSAEPRLG